jgi:hypothetical protein
MEISFPHSSYSEVKESIRAQTHQCVHFHIPFMSPQCLHTSDTQKRTADEIRNSWFTGGQVEVRTDDRISSILVLSEMHWAEAHFTEHWPPLPLRKESLTGKASIPEDAYLWAGVAVTGAVRYNRCDGNELEGGCHQLFCASPKEWTSKKVVWHGLQGKLFWDRVKNWGRHYCPKSSIWRLK